MLAARRTLKLVFAVAVFGWPTAAQGQRSDTVTFEVSLGGVTGIVPSRDYAGHGQATIEVAVGFRAHPDQDFGLISALGVGGNMTIAHGDVCVLNATFSACLPQPPEVAH